MNREQAITASIEAAVEAFIAGDPEADDLFDMAVEFSKADEKMFPYAHLDNANSHLHRS